MLAGIIICIILGFTLRSGKGDWLIAGYNMMAEEEKSKYDKLKLCKCIGNLMIFIAVILITNFICDKYIKIPHENSIFMILILISIFGTAIYANTGNRFIKR
ncbi:MAG: DUF3784 domain-containing protein [Clostridium sp.]|nr:DUF3784 domain-containing protein [Clostridium sp.]